MKMDQMEYLIITQWYEAWGEIVQLYSACNLTKRKDNLVALAGIAKTLADRGRSQGGYFAGIFERTLPHGLLWHRAARQASLVRSPSYREPSWYWASVDEGVSFEDTSLKRKSENWREKGTAWDTPGPNGRPVAKKIEISTISLTKESDLYGQVIGGHIVLNGPLVVAKFPQCASSAEVEGYELLPRVEVMDKAAVFDTPSDNIGQERVCLPGVLKQTVFLVGTLSGLILSTCVSKDKWSFTRIGLFRCKTESVSLAGD